jgi:hypothetical protein
MQHYCNLISFVCMLARVFVLVVVKQHQVAVERAHAV